MQQLAFREFARAKLYQYRESPTKTFLVLDEDRDGMITSKDIARFLLRYHVRSSFLTSEEICGWFSGICQRDPYEGINMAEFCTFLNAGIGKPTEYDAKSGKLSAEIISKLEHALVTYEARLSVDFIGLHKALAGGEGFLYEHELRKFFENEYQYFFGDDQWARICNVLKYNRHVEQITREELYDFLMGKIEEEPTRGIIDVAECEKAEFMDDEDNPSDFYSYDEESEDTIEENGQNNTKTSETMSAIEYDTPGTKLERVCPKLSEADTEVEALGVEEHRTEEQLEGEEETPKRISHQHCIPDWPPRNLDKSGLGKLECEKTAPKCRKEVDSPLRFESNSPEIKSHSSANKNLNVLSCKPATRDTLVIEPLPLNANSMEKFHETSVRSTPDMLLHLISEKIKQTGEPRTLFRKFDVNKVNRLSFRVFSEEIEQQFGIVISPDQCKQCVELLAPNAAYIDYELFLRFYDAQHIIQELQNTKKFPSQCRSHEKVEEFMVSEETENRLVRAEEVSNAANSAATTEIEQSRASALGEEGLRAVELEAGDVISSTYPGNLKFEKEEKIEYPFRLYEEAVARSGEAEALTVNEVAHSVVKRSEDPALNRSYALVNETGELMDKQEREEENNFIIKCVEMLELRGESIRKCIRESFPNKTDLNSNELVWFFRNIIGCSFSPSVILKTFDMRDGDYIDKAAILNRFRGQKTKYHNAHMK